MKSIRRWRGALLAVPVVVVASVSVDAVSDDRSDAKLDREAIARIQPVPYKDMCAATMRPGFMRCLSKVVTDDNGNVRAMGPHPVAAPQGLGPSDMQLAYKLPSSGGVGKIVATVDAYDTPNAEADLATYRQQYGLPPCTTANGCFKRVDQNGGTNYPPQGTGQEAGWAGETMLDLDMISAACPDCKILLVEANDSSSDALGTGVNTAATLGAAAISNSYGGPEDGSVTQTEAYYHHAGVLVTASSGDAGYGTSYPASSQWVLAVGGTALTTSGSARGWAETAWSSGGSGCSAFIPKPSYQSDPGCSNFRMEADVAAVADPNTGVAVYSSSDGGWIVVGGTSASSPLVAAMFTLFGLANTDYGWVYSHKTAFYDIISGSNGSCTTSYMCHAGAGYDGPTGWGTPNGTALAAANGPCTAADNGVRCNGSTPVCETDTTNANAGKCVACTSNTQCTTPAAPSCHRTTDTCGGCTKDTDCAAPTPKCEVSSGTCHGCLTNADCTNPSKPTCDATTKTCRGCVNNADCTPPLVCSASGGTCGNPGGGGGGGGGGTGGGGGGGTGGGGGGGTGGGGGGGHGGGGGGGTGGGGGGGDSSQPTVGQSSGCAVSTGDAAPGLLGITGLLVGLAAFSRRRTRG